VEKKKAKKKKKKKKTKSTNLSSPINNCLLGSHRYCIELNTYNIVKKEQRRATHILLSEKCKGEQESKKILHLRYASKGVSLFFHFPGEQHIIAVIGHLDIRGQHLLLLTTSTQQFHSSLEKIYRKKHIKLTF